MTTTYDVSIITPVHNAAQFLPACLKSLIQQTFTGSMQLSMYDDASKDNSVQIVEDWRCKLEERGVAVVLTGGTECRGQGYARNRAIEQCSSRYLCFLDADDVMTEDRILKQHEVAVSNPRAIVGSRFVRVPADSTVRYTAWANRLTPEQLYTQIYTSHGPTMILPTWFCSREVYEAVGQFVETGPGTPEDLHFYLRHLDLGGQLVCIPEVLLTYTYHKSSVTSMISENTIWNVRVEAIQRNVMESWDSFTIWNAGRQGRRLYRCLNVRNRKKVVAFCDVDPKKIAQGVYIYEDCPRDEEEGGSCSRDSLSVRPGPDDRSKHPKPRVPIVHFTQAQPPFIVCIKLDMTDGAFEHNLASLNLREGVDFFHFN